MIYIWIKKAYDRFFFKKQDTVLACLAYNKHVYLVFIL